MFNFREVYKNSKTPPTFFITGLDGSMIEIYPYAGGSEYLASSNKNFLHLAIAVNDFENAIEDLKNKGINFSEKPKEASGGVKVIFMRDPEDNLLQLIYRPNPLRKNELNKKE
jgi:catechol 2,3-dioxygenase-like lactoylglutathione lyase family enzyme